MNSAFAQLDLVIKDLSIPFSRPFLRLGGTQTRGKRSVPSVESGVTDGLSCVLAMDGFCYTLLMASALPAVPPGDQILSYQYSAVGLPPLLTAPSRRSARQLNTLGTSILILASSALRISISAIRPHAPSRSYAPTMEPSKAYIESSDGKRIYAEMHPGDGGADADPTPIVFIHGFLYSSSSFTPVLSYLTARTRVILDLEGRGRSTRESTASWSLDSAVSTIVLVLSHFGYLPGTKVDVVAHSQGGISLAVLFSQSANPSTFYKVRRLVLMGPADPAEPPEMALAFAYQVRSQETDDLVLFLLSWLGADAKSNQELISSVSDKLFAHVSHNRQFVSHMIKAAVSAPGVWTAKGSVDELWIVFGRQDGYFGWSVRTMAENKKDVDTGHFFMWENAEATGRALQEILQPGS